MKTIYPKDNYSPSDPLAIALGNFDGVHLGHAKLMEQVVKAKKLGLKPAAVIFEKDPENCLAKSIVSPVITNNKEKARILENMGLELVIYISFEETKNLSPYEFVKMLVEKYNAKLLVCGFHYHFGKHASGNAKQLEALCNEFKIGYSCVDAVVKEGLVVSSTAIRGLLALGEVEKAALYLGRNFAVEGVVLKGKQLGRTLGFPTVNIAFEEDSVVLQRGVYITKVTVNGKEYGGITNIGVRPTVENTLKCNIETNILDFNGDIYGENIRIEFLKMLRREKKFENVEQLKEAVFADREKARNFFEKTIYNQ